MANPIGDIGQRAIVTGKIPPSSLETSITSNRDKEGFICGEICNITRKDWCDNFNQHIG